MATNVDIIIRAVVADAKKKLDSLAASVYGVADAEKPVTRSTEDLQRRFGELVPEFVRAGATTEQLMRLFGLTAGELQSLGVQIDVVTEATTRQADQLIRMPEYLLGYRGGWVNLITMLTTGASVFAIAHRAINEFTEAIQAAIEANRRLSRQVEAATQIWGAYKKGIAEGIIELARIGTEGEGALQRLSRFHVIIEAIGTTIETTGIPILREYGTILEKTGEAFGETGRKSEEAAEGIDRIAGYYQDLIDQHAEEAFEAQRQAIFETSNSVGEYTLKTMSLLSTLGLLGPILKEIGLEALNSAIGLDYAARKTEKFAKTLERFFGVVERGISAFRGTTDYMSDLISTQETYADRTEDIAFRAAQAWESYQFRVAQAVDAFNFRMGQMQAQFQHQMWSLQARFNASQKAAAARHALDVETIRQDHYDRLSDMVKQHQEEERRLLQRAPWYLQRYIWDYQQRREELEEKGDKEGLQRLRENFLERIRTIDPIYAKELEQLLESQRDERDAEDREFKQRLSRSSRQYEISRKLAQEQHQIALADAIFAYQQQQAAAEFAHRQQLESMLFAYQQQQEASGRAYAEALEDQVKALNEREEQFKGEMKSWVKKFHDLGYEAGRAWTTGMTEGMHLPSPPTPSPTTPPSPRQRGTYYVPSTMAVTVHPGEAILRREQAAAWRSGYGGSQTISIYLYGPIYMRTRQEVSQLATEISREVGRRAILRGA